MNREGWVFIFANGGMIALAITAIILANFGYGADWVLWFNNTILLNFGALISLVIRKWRVKE